MYKGWVADGVYKTMPTASPPVRSYKRDPFEALHNPVKGAWIDDWIVRDPITKEVYGSGSTLAKALVEASKTAHIKRKWEDYIEQQSQAFAQEIEVLTVLNQVSADIAMDAVTYCSPPDIND